MPLKHLSDDADDDDDDEDSVDDDNHFVLACKYVFSTPLMLQYVIFTHTKHTFTTFIFIAIL